MTTTQERRTDWLISELDHKHPLKSDKAKLLRAQIASLLVVADRSEWAEIREVLASALGGLLVASE